MNAIRTTTQPESRSENNTRTRVSWGADLVTIVLGLWLIGGVFADGFAHNNLRDTLEGFFSPWHAILYSGFTATALWIAWLVAGQARAGLRGLNALPIGYEWGALGVIVFGLGGVGDLIWHSVFGIEVGTSALLSPTHLRCDDPDQPSSQRLELEHERQTRISRVSASPAGFVRGV
jgi:hypothetical protein